MVSRIFPLLVVLLFWRPPQGFAVPNHITFQEMIKESDTIVVAKQLEKPDRVTHTVLLDVLQVLKGGLKSGKQRVEFGNYPHGGPGEFIAFLDKALVWRFVAVPLEAKKNIDKGPLVMRGFYDTNAYFVTPAAATLDQIKTYLKDGSLPYRFRGEVFFPLAGKAAWKNGTLTINGMHDAIQNKTEIKGLPNLKGFPAQPEVWIHDKPGIDLQYARSLKRPFNLAGEIHGFDEKSGDFLLRFAVSDPDMLSQQSLEAYLSDPRKGPCSHRLKLECSASKERPELKALTLRLGKRTTTQWSVDQLEGWEKDPLEFTFSSGVQFGSGPFKLTMTTRTKNGVKLALNLDLIEPKHDGPVFTWTFQNRLLYSVYCRPAKGTLFLADRYLTDLTAKWDASEFNPIEED